MNEGSIAKQVAPGNSESSISVIARRYFAAKAAATAQACDANPDIAPHALLNSDSHNPGASNLAGAYSSSGQRHGMLLLEHTILFAVNFQSNFTPSTACCGRCAASIRRTIGF
jgi:hypothetical protein